jgi:Lhr-like helicase
MSEIIPTEVEHVLETHSGFNRVVAVMVGIVAVTAALLALLEADSKRRADEASTRGDILASQIFVETAASSMYETFRLTSLQDATAASLQATARLISAFKHPAARAFAVPLSEAETAAAKRATAILQVLGRAPTEQSGVDEAARQAIESSVAQEQRLVKTQNGAVGASEHYSGRSERAILGLSLAAIAAAMLGLCGIVGPGRPGRILLLVAIAAALAAIASGASGLAL